MLASKPDQARGTGGSFDWILVTGSSLYWAGVLLMFLFPGSTQYTSTAGFILGKLTTYSILAVCSVVGFLAPVVFSSDRGRRAIGLAALVSLVANLLISVPAIGLHVALFVRVMVSFMRVFAIAMLMILWGFAFASLDKKAASCNVTLSALCTVCVVLVGSFLCKVIPAAQDLSLSSAIGSVLLIPPTLLVVADRVRFISHHRDRVPASQGGSLAPFIFTRAAFGLALGVCLVLVSSLETDASSSRLLVLDLALTLLGIALLSRGQGEPYSLHPAIIALAVMGLYLPFLQQGLSSAVEASAALVWLVWSMLSAVQLSDLKERLGMSELRVCLVDKLALNVSVIVGIALGPVIGWVADAADGAALAVGVSSREIVILAILGTLTVTAVYQMARLVEARSEDALHEQVARNREQRAAELLGSMAQEFGLTPREREVLGMLAEGYTRSYISAKLNVSDGTAKAHVAHIYAKLGVHRRDELLKLIEGKV